MLEKRVGEWVFSFFYKEGNLRQTYLAIGCDSGIFSCRIGGNTHAYGYLLAAARQGRDEQLHGYATTLYIPAMAMTGDQELTDGIQAAVRGWVGRKDAQGAAAAASASETELTADQALMEELADGG